MELTVNGEVHVINPGESVSSVIQRLGLNAQLVAVELNRQIVRRTEFDTRILEPGDRLEVVEFVGGG
ncbi:MAG: sulfur carrier protein ThiS [Acidobacteriota bacterium]